MQTILYRDFAQTYGAGAYNQSTYQTGTSASTAANGSGGSLSNTGIAVVSIVTLAAIVLLVALVVRIWRRPGRQAALEISQQSVPDDDATGQVPGSPSIR